MINLNRNKKLQTHSTLFVDNSFGPFSPKVNTSISFRKNAYDVSQSTFNRSTAFGTEYREK